MRNALSTKLNTISVNAASKKKAMLIGGIAGTSVLAAATVPVFATANGFKEIAKVIADVFKQFYEAAIGVISVIAIVLIAICLLMRMLSKDQRKVDEATSWMKRIIITWVIFFFLGNIQSLVEDIGEAGSDVNWG